MGCDFGCGGGGLWASGRNTGVAGGDRRLLCPGLIEVVFRHRFRLGGVELRSLIEVVGKPLLGGLFMVSAAEVHVELGLGRPPGRMEERGRSGAGHSSE